MPSHSGGRQAAAEVHVWSSVLLLFSSEAALPQDF